ncbi:MAG: phosphoribosylformylglycinamidine cyclo-ligase [Anaerolineales bacterium]
MAKNKPGLVKTTLDELTYKVNGLAMRVQRELKSGHKEVFYQRRLAELCREAGLQIEMEKHVEVWIGDSLVGYLYLDLWVEQSLVVECKAFDHDLTDDELSQVLVYLAATSSPVGMLYNFGRPSLEFKRVLRPANMQEWQKYLYRCVWALPGTTLPSESGHPIRFSVISPLADQPVVLQSAAPSVLIRESVKESVEKSDYAAAGVSIEAGNRAVELMKSAVKSTYGPQVLAGIGSFGGLFDASALKEMKNPVLVASTDGVGTKVKLAAEIGRYRSVGQDIVNHCIDDILVQGARPLFFMDYFATSKLTPEIVAEVVTGIAEACRASGCALLGGETAEMPGVYAPGEFDIAGTIVGVLERDAMLPRADIGPGDVLIGVRSSGPHTNGYSLIRKIFQGVSLDTVFPELGVSLADALLAPHRSYLPILSTVLRPPSSVKGLAHLTGGGFIENIPRILPDDVDAVVHQGSWPVPPLFSLIQARGEIATEEMHRVFNMGIGMVLVVAKNDVDKVQKAISEETFVIGELVKGERKTRLVG